MLRLIISARALPFLFYMKKISRKRLRVWGNFSSFFIILCKANLTLKEQEFIIWHYYNNMTYKEMRKMTGYSISRQRIHQIVSQGIRKLRRHFTREKYSVYFN